MLAAQPTQHLPHRRVVGRVAVPGKQVRLGDRRQPRVRSTRSSGRARRGTEQDLAARPAGPAPAARWPTLTNGASPRRKPSRYSVPTLAEVPSGGPAGTLVAGKSRTGG